MAKSHLAKIQLHSLVPSKRTSHIGKMHFYTAHLSETGVRELTNNHTQVVDYFVKDQTFRVQELVQPNPPNWGLSRIDSRSGTDSAFRFPTAAGQGVDVYVLDTGVNAQQTDLVGRVTSAPSFIGNATDARLTFGVAKKSNIISVKALTSDGEGQMSNVLLALEWVVQRHQSNPNAKSIVNLSLSGNYSQTTNDAIQEAIDAGIHFAIAAGNEGVDACEFSPASSPNAITVGASNQNDTVASYSNYGRCVDLYAPGTDIVSAWNTGATATNTLSGTSVASPFVAGVMALYLGQQAYNPYELRDLIVNSSTLLQEQLPSGRSQFDNIDPSSNFHLLYSGNWSTDGTQKIYEIASSKSTPQTLPNAFTTTIAVFFLALILHSQ
ncbi:hypothetical protein Unana1_00942 [Umbelopsis nana]